MFGTIRRHQQWLWWIIVVAIVVTFIFWGSQSSRTGGGNGGDKGKLGSISGEAISVEDYQAVGAEVQLSYFLGHGNWPDRDPAAKQSGYNEQREIYQRLFLIQKQKEYNIHVSREAIGTTAAQILHSLGRNGTAVPLDEFETQLLKPRGLTKEDFARMLEHELGVRQLVTALGLTGKLTTPQEAEMLLRAEREEITTEAVFFSATNYVAAVKATPEFVGQFYTNQMERYRIADRRQVSYLKFKGADFLADADAQIAKLTNFTAQVDAVYLQRGTNYYKDLSPDAAKKEIRDEYRKGIALRAARNKAAEFADELLNLAPVKLDNLETLAKQKGFTAEISAPFTAETGPVELDVPSTFAKTAFALTAEEPFAGPIVGENDVFVIGLKRTIPSEIPSLDSIRAKVTADYEILSARQIACNVGTNFAHTVATTPMKTFAGISADFKLSPIKFPAFSLTTRALPEVEGHIRFGELQEIAYGLPVGGNSGFVPTQDGGFILHVIARTPVDNATVKAELPAFLAQVRQTRQNEAFNAWFSREAQTGLRDTPLARPTAIGSK
jgi:hypothetical protein